MFAPTQTRVNGTNSATGHQYGTVSYFWANDYSSCTAHNTCTSCNAEFSKTVVKTSGSDSPIVYSEKQQTCFQSGEKKYTATFENSTIFPQTVLIVESTPKLEHVWGEATFSWSVGDDGKATCTARVNCTRPLNDTTCGGSYSYTISDIAPVLNEKGETTYTADFRNITTLPENIRVKFGVQTHTVPGKLYVTYTPGEHVISTVTASYTLGGSTTSLGSSTFNYGGTTTSKSFDKTDIVLNDTNTYVIFAFSFKNNATSNNTNSRVLKITVSEIPSVTNMNLTIKYKNAATAPLASLTKTDFNNLADATDSTAIQSIGLGETGYMYVMVEIQSGLQGFLGSISANTFAFQLSASES